ncbi:hypothetical protein AAV35_001080 [Salimicrobium jeotgali]|uniref:Uncharacterized protein n=1 Tax=Salimicrobium jeotgali TaxID=1230341 RepID=A0AAC8T6B2_9BACI|nr:hypothetical protein AAV35_001080 [Salimicrobium jeotgali]
MAISVFLDFKTYRPISQECTIVYKNVRANARNLFGRKKGWFVGLCLPEGRGVSKKENRFTIQNVIRMYDNIKNKRET